MVTINNQNSIVDRIIEITHGTAISEIEMGGGNYQSEMAWYTYLINSKAVLYNSS